MSTLTERKVSEMLTENTGRHMLDSGGAYGRNWERNQGHDFSSDDPATLTLKYGYIEYTKNVFHFICENLEYSPEWQRKFSRYANKAENEDKYWLQLMGEFADIHSEDGDEYKLAENTYNGETNLSQVLQYQQFTAENGDLVVLLQIHGGCDVRGGYTAPKAFVASPYNEYPLAYGAHGTIMCEDDRGHVWDTDDAYHWYYQGSCGLGAGQQLEEYESQEVDEIAPALAELRKYKEVKPEGNAPVYIDGDGHGYCPICGGKLIAA